VATTGTAPLPLVASVPVSFPLIRLAQFIQYLVVAHVSGLSPSELSACFSGASGHSPGLVTAVAIFTSKDDAPFLENVHNAPKWFFFAGVRGQQLLPVLALEPSVVQDSIQLIGERVNPC
jgi:fatty acid synthase subunit beta